MIPGAYDQCPECNGRALKGQPCLSCGGYYHSNLIDKVLWRGLVALVLTMLFSFWHSR